MKLVTRGALLRLVLAGLVISAGTWWCMIRMPGRSHEGDLPPLDPATAALRDELARDVRVLAGEIGERNLQRFDALTAAADFIATSLQGAGHTVTSQEYEVQGRACRNLEAELPGTVRPSEVVVVGAHYDSVPGCPGANDNATGVAALLALARRFRQPAAPRTLRFVAFVNEEPPWFRTSHMGSRRYADRCAERGDRIVAMLSLETLGYYRDDRGSQNYPFPFQWFYPDTGNFVAFVGNLRSRTLVRRSVALFRAAAAFPSEGGALPGWMPGIGWSDHHSFWRHGVPAVMVTDTAPFRYPWYHRAGDTPERIDDERLARVVAGLGAVVAGLAAGD